jgi:hypothetical protein
MSLLVEVDSESELRLLEAEGVIRSLQERVSFAEKKLDEATAKLALEAATTAATITKVKEKTKRAGQMQGELRLLLKDALKVLTEDRHPTAIALRERIQTALDK